MGNSENFPELDALEEQFMSQITQNEATRGLMSDGTNRQEALTRGRRPGLGGLRAEAAYINRPSNLLLDDDITMEVNQIRSNLENSEEGLFLWGPLFFQDNQWWGFIEYEDDYWEQSGKPNVLIRSFAKRVSLGVSIND